MINLQKEIRKSEDALKKANLSDLELTYTFMTQMKRIVKICVFGILPFGNTLVIIAV